MSSSAQITDPAHAVRVLEALVEQTNKNFIPFLYDMGEEGGHGITQALALIPALIEGIKAVLKIKDEGYVDQRDAKEDVIEALAQTCAPWMVEAGMTIPK